MTQTNEFQYAIPAVKIGAEPYRVTFEADERARGQLARRYGILSVDALSGEASLRREADGMTIGVTGHFSALVTQACVTTLEPVQDRIGEDFEGWFLDESQATSFQRARRRKLEVDAGDLPPEEDESHLGDERDDPETVVNGMVELGELVAQYLSLALNPYPHSKAALAQGPLGDDKTLEKPGPFDVLKDLKA